MPELRIPLDPLNPGHFFACCGLFELHPAAIAWFVIDERAPRRADFVIESDSPFDLACTLASLRDASYEALPYPQKAIQPIRATIGSRAIVLDWWLDIFREQAQPLKCWAGQVTSAKLFADLPPLLQSSLDPAHLFSKPELTRSKLGIDPRSAWNALDFGFSPDKHNRDSATYPAVEMLGAFGLQAFRPDTGRRDSVSYHLWTVPLPVAVARLAAVSPWPGLPHFHSKFSIAKRGQSYKFFTFASFVERK